MITKADLGRLDRGGMLSGLTATFFWGTTFIVTRDLLMYDKVDSLSLVFYRFFFGGVFTFLFMLLTGQKLLPKNRRELWHAAVLGFYLYFLMSAFSFYGQKTVSATVGALFLESGVVVAVLLWRFLSRQPMTKREIGSCLVCIAGALLVLNVITARGFCYDTNHFIGQAAFLAALIFWVIGSYYGKRCFDGENILRLTAWAQLLTGLMILPVLPFFPDYLIAVKTPQAWAEIIYLAIFPTAVAFVTWNIALKKMELWQSSMLQNLTPVVTCTGAWLLLGETMTPMNLLGVFLVLSGVSWATLRSRQSA